ncbi:carbohydrate-binding protein [Flavobacterium zepuense]|uniref:Carbohydrate-binding protein n=1 Tax=Flavobacterium zepuense TaxID=2593302 RepID=A0A552V7J6_9FLAO|nr:carbohydrate-binding protein [Flavobacterium zepuense]TRW26442.1 carbohydrate-binding protein [Flavobacterium zepuense]
MKKLLSMLMLALALPAFSQGYLHQSGQNIVNGNGDNVLLRGLGLGGWMLQEGYMLQTDGFAGPQHEIRQKIQDLIGPSATEAFYQAYRDNGITEADIVMLKEMGFNSVRLPMHYNLYTLPIEAEPVAGQNTWLTEGFERTDELLQWCADNEMYLILDMHGAPGGQGKDANISDYDDTKPSLWESADNRNKMIALWVQLADRYKNSPWIGAYDLINEPNWNFTGTNQNGCDEGSNIPLRQLMVDITAAIRAVDTNHMIIIEGNCWGNNYNGIFPLWDNNMAVSFHKYWNNNSTGSIQGMLNIRTQQNVPIWLGESGENSNVWFKDAISLVESNNIGWAFWPVKKVESIAGITYVTKNAGYQQLLNYWNNGGTAPSASVATAALMELAENFKNENITIRRDVVDAMFRQVQTNETLPYVAHPLPGKVYAADYDLGTNGYAYKDNVVATYHTDGGSYTAWNNGWTGRNDGVDVQACTDATTNGYQVGYIENNEWLLFTIPSATEMAYDIDIRYAGPTGKLHLEDENGWISESIALPSTGGYDVYGTVTLNDVILKAGTNKVKVFFEIGNFNLNYLDFKNPVPSNQADFKVVNAATNVLGDKVEVLFNKDLASGINLSQSNLSLKVNGNAVAVTNADMGTAESGIILTPATPINAGDVVTLTYAGTNLVAADATVQPAFTDKAVVNNVGNIQQISGLIEAESFYVNNGLTPETTTDVGGGQNLGYTDAGDYLDYLVNINAAGNYKIEYRTAGLNATGGIKLQLINDTTQDVQTVTLSPTGGWQTWATTNSQAVLPAGRYYLRANVTASGFNINWIKFTLMAPDDDNDGVANSSDLCPGTPVGDVVDFSGCTLFTLPGSNFAVATASETCRTANNGTISVSATANHNYVGTVTGNGVNQTANFTTATTFSNLSAGTYQLCVTLPEAPSYQQCFELTITEPEDISALARMMPEKNKVELDLFGDEIYTVTLNKNTFTTTLSTIELTLKPGVNNIEVKGQNDCQGTFRQSIVLDETISVYPNPVNGNTVYVAMAVAENEKVHVEIFNLLGKLVVTKDYNNADDVLSVDVAPLAAGVYIMKVVSGSTAFNTKIVKE